MRKFKGFTLAEVLITLTIIGIIAAISIPALKNAADKNAWAAGLSTSVKNLTSAFALMKANDSVDTLDSTDFWTNNVTSDVTSGSADIRNEFAKYLEIEKMSNGVPSSIKIFDFDHTSSSDLTDTIRFNLANKTAINIVLRPYSTNANCSTIQDGGGSLCEKVADIYVDVNGDKLPNTFGKDIYLFYLSNEGRLFPYGGKDVNLYENAAPLWDSTEGCKGKAKDIKSGKACTGRVVEEGYRISY